MSVQENVLTELIEKVQTQAKMVSEIQVKQSCQNSVPHIISSVITLTGPTYGASKNMKPLTLLHFLGTLPTLQDEAPYKLWIFQVSSCRKSYTDEAEQNAVISNVRQSAGLVVRAVGCDATLDAMLERLVHQLSQGSRESGQEYAAKLECLYYRLQERFPGHYIPAQLKDRVFYGMNNKLRDSMRFLYKQPHTTFEELLADTMLAEKEFILHSTGHAKVVMSQSGTPVTENPMLGMDAIQEQLEVINQYLKGANLKGVLPKPVRGGTPPQAVRPKPSQACE